MKKRIISGIVFGLIFFPSIYFGGIYFLLVSLFCGAVGTFELMNMFYKKSKTLNVMRFVVPAFSVIIIFLMHMFEAKVDCYSFAWNGISLSLIKDVSISANLFVMYLGLMLASYMLFTLIFFVFMVLKKDATAYDLLACITSLTYGGLLLGAAFNLEYFKPISYSGEGTRWGGQVLAYVYAVVCLTDVFAYLVGRKFGKHKLCPHISPKKTIEGSIGGLVIASVLGVGIAKLFGVMPVSSSSSSAEIIAAILAFLLSSIVISILSQIGDLAASRLKRTYEIKDYGNIMPGHGGIMDRFDSFILAGSIIYVFAMISKLIFIGFGL